MSSLIEELQRRNIIKVATAYAVASFVVLQICDITFPALGLEDAAIGNVIVALVLLFPVVLALAWVFELTPEGFRPTVRVDVKESIASQTGRILDRVVIVLLSVALIFFAGEYFFPSQNPEAPAAADATESETSVTSAESTTVADNGDSRPSVAVLPFVNMSSDVENEYFSDGLSEELLNVLAQSSGLRVAGRTSSFFYKGRNQDLTEIGQALRVGNILEGSVRKSGDKVRITAQLISTIDGFHLWSKTYDRELDDIFAVQDEIAHEVAQAMRVTLLTDGVQVVDRTTSNPEAYDIYLRAKEALYRRTFADVRRSVDLFQEANALDPEYGPPLIDYASALAIMYSNSRYGDLLDVGEKALAALDKAKALGYTGSDYHSAMGLYYMHMLPVRPDLEPQAEASFQRAIELNPNNTQAYIWYSNLKSEDGLVPDHDKAMELMSKALEIDPLNRVANGNYQIQLARVNRVEESESNLRRLMKLDPEYHTYSWVLANILIFESRYVEAADLITGIPLSYGRLPFIVSRLLWTFDDDAAVYDFYGKIPVDHPQIDYINLIENTMKLTPPELRADAEIILIQPDNDGYGVLLSNAMLDLGEYDLARRLVEHARPNLAKETPELSGSGFSGTDSYLTAIYMLGQKERATSVAQDLLQMQQHEDYVGVGGREINGAVCQLVLGNREAAIADIVNAHKAGWTGYYRWNLDTHPILSRVVDDPRIMQVRSAIDAELSRQREDVYQRLYAANMLSSVTL